MKKIISIVLCALGLSCVNGCSFAMRPAPSSLPASPYEPVRCTSSRAAPVLDTVMGGVLTTATIGAAGETIAYSEKTSSTQNGTNDSINFTLGLGAVAAIYVVSAVVGYNRASECREMKQVQTQRMLTAPVPVDLGY